MFPSASLSDLPAFRIGHAQNERAGTGCTVVVAPEGATCGVDVRGGGPATRETDLLKPENMIEAVHAVVLSGGSAFGLEASCGVMDALAERGIGFPLGEARVPIVVGACLFDLLVGEPAYPDKAMGRQAAENALATWGASGGEPTSADGKQTADGGKPAGRAAEEPPCADEDDDGEHGGDAPRATAPEAGEGGPGVPMAARMRGATHTGEGRESPTPRLAQGNVGAGCGATVGKLGTPDRAMKSGFGWSCLRAGDVVAAALVAVNALGCVRDENGAWIAGVRDDDGRVMDPLAALAAGPGAADADERVLTPASSSAPATAGDLPAEPDVAAAPSREGAAGGLCQNTTIGVVLTNARLTKAQATKVSSTVHDAYARAIKPVHTSNDGDTVFTFASGEVEAPTDLVAVAATEAMQQAIVSAVKAAEGAFGLPAARDLA